MKYIFLILIASFALQVQSQKGLYKPDDQLKVFYPTKNYVYFETALVINSIGYERVILTKNRIGFIIGLGGNFYQFTFLDETDTELFLTAKASVIWGGPHHFVESGIWLPLKKELSSSPHIYPLAPLMGYRFQKKNRFYFKADLRILFEDNYEGNAYATAVYPTIGLGTTF